MSIREGTPCFQWGNQIREFNPGVPIRIENLNRIQIKLCNYLTVKILSSYIARLCSGSSLGFSCFVDWSKSLSPFLYLCFYMENAFSFLNETFTFEMNPATITCENNCRKGFVFKTVGSEEINFFKLDISLKLRGQMY